MECTFERLVAFAFQGVNSALRPTDLEVSVPDSRYRCVVKVVDALGDQLQHADEEQAVRAGLLQAVAFGDAKFDDLVAQVRRSRRVAGGYVVVRIQGPAALDMSQTHRDFGTVVVGFSGALFVTHCSATTSPGCSGVGALAAA